MDKIDELRDRLKKFLIARDWEKFHNARDLAISISLEASELLEVFQWKDNIKSSDLVKDEKLLAKIKEELADVLIYCLNLANNLNLDIYEIVENKIKKNEEKYPANKVKSSAKKYTEYD
ncbi:MazG-like family protein [Candidatus Tiddalikarchaeum anstoanum]|nr:MazG-like family protein [Candidatus Tiddalikarchaeum anstoanum]